MANNENARYSIDTSALIHAWRRAYLFRLMYVALNKVALLLLVDFVPSGV